MDGQDTEWHRNIAENFNRLSREHERYRQTGVRRATAYSESEREFSWLKSSVKEGNKKGGHEKAD